MSLALTFSENQLLDSTLIGTDGAVYYTTSTSSGFLLGRKVTTITAAGGLVGIIDWRRKIFTINGVKREWHHLKSRTGGIFSSQREWNWGNKPYTLKYRDSNRELLATPNSGNAERSTVRFTSYRFRDNEPAVIYFPHQMQDEVEKMFLLMVILKTEIRQQDARQERAPALRQHPHQQHTMESQSTTLV
ncbi:hypothetical protein B0H11DRAFT_2282234 [Mycena galericulata]|nr:hypothetical protein B0H11DRAFT_2282234 [Mycena galericulata]